MGTTINIDPATRDRLKEYGHAGMTYDEILRRLMDDVDKRAFIAEMRRLAAQTREADWVALEDLEDDDAPQGQAPPRGRRAAQKAPARRQARRPGRAS